MGATLLGAPAIEESPAIQIGVGIDTARYGHRVTFLRPDLQAAAPPLDVEESRAGYQRLRQALERLARQPGVRFHVRLDAAGQYAANLEQFLRELPLPLEISVGQPHAMRPIGASTIPSESRTTPTAARWPASQSWSSRPSRPPRPWNC